jgi:hypothetical protein
LFIASAKNNERIEDSTYDEADNVPEKGAKFFEFIGAELLPYLEKIPYCSLQNHSGTRYDSWIPNFSL